MPTADDGPGADIVPIRQSTATDPILRALPAPPRCRQHDHFEIAVEERRVYCANCGREVDPLDALLVFERQWSRHAHNLKALLRDERLARARLGELKRQENNAKSRARRRGEQPDRQRTGIAEQKVHARLRSA